MALKAGGSPYRSNVKNDIKTRLGTFVDGGTCTGAVLLKELLQNADDAGAKYLLIVLDERAAPTDAPEAFASLLGPALLVANDGPFNEDQLDAITKVASGQKLADNAATGRFGVGFTSVFLVGDVCLLCSQGSLIVFDLLRQIIPTWAKLEGSEAGKDDEIWTTNRQTGHKGHSRWMNSQQNDILRHVLGSELFADHAMRAAVSGMPEGLKAPFGEKVSVFRIPFRTRATNHAETLYSGYFDEPETRSTLFDEMKEEARHCMVFLRSVERITLVKYSHGRVQDAFECKVSPWGKEAKAYFDVLRAGKGQHESQFQKRTVAISGEESREYLVSMKVDFDNEEFADMREDNSSWKKCVPCGAVAICANHSTTDAERWRVLLPLTREGPSAALINGGFFLDQARHAPTFRAGSTGGETAWNKEIIRTFIVPLLRALLEKVSEEQRLNEKTAIGTINTLPVHIHKKDGDASTLSEQAAITFHQHEWLIRIVDANGSSFELSRASIIADNTHSQLLLQELPAILDAYRDLLPAQLSGRSIRYISSPVYRALSQRFPNAKLLYSASRMLPDIILAVLKDVRFAKRVSSTELHELVKRIPRYKDLRNSHLKGAHLFWSSRGPIPWNSDDIYVTNTADKRTAFEEVTQSLGVRINRLVRVDAGVGAGDIGISEQLGLPNVKQPSDDLLLTLLKEVHPDHNKHDKYEPDEILRATDCFQQLMVRIAKANPERLKELKLAWTVCTESNPDLDDLRKWVVVHVNESDAVVMTLWDSFLSEVCLRVHKDLLDFHRKIQTALDKRPNCLDQDDVQVVRTKKNEILAWLGQIFWQGGNIARQRKVIGALSETIEILANREDGRGADALLDACSKQTISDTEYNLLCCLPIHRTADGRHIALGTPEERYRDRCARQRDVANRFRLQPREDVAPPPGVEDNFTLLNPPEDLRGFYERDLGIKTHNGRCAVLDLLQTMNTPEKVDIHLHRLRLKYLMVKYPAARQFAEQNEQEELDRALGGARLVPSDQGIERASDTVDVVDAENELCSKGWKKPDAQRITSLLTSPKRIARWSHPEERSWLETLRALPVRLTVDQLPLGALQSENADLSMSDRMSVIARFYDRLPKQCPSPSPCLLQMSVPLLAGGKCALRDAELLPTGLYGFSRGVVAVFFPNAINVEALANQSATTEDQLRDGVLELLELQELPHSTAAKRIRDGLSQYWNKLKVSEQCEIVEQSKSLQIPRDKLFPLAFASLAGKSTQGDALGLYKQLVELAVNPEGADAGEKPKTQSPDVIQPLVKHLVFPCRDAKFHPVDQCWFSSDLTQDVDLKEGREFVIANSDDVERLKSWANQAGASQYTLEECCPARLDADAVAFNDSAPSAIGVWCDLLRLLKQPDAELRKKVEEIFKFLPFRWEWELKLAQELRVVYANDSGVAVRPKPTWRGPEVVAHQGILWIRHDAVPEASETKRVSAFDHRVARELLLGLGIARHHEHFDKLLEELVRELDRPEDELNRLKDRRSERLIERYAEMKADERFSASYRDWDRLKKGSEGWRQKRTELEKIAKSGMLEARRKEMAELGYSIESFYSEMAQNAEDACLQREELDMGPPAQTTLTFRREGGELWIEHYGRPFNYWRNDGKEIQKFREDIERITGDRDSFKQQGNGPAVTGRFGVGFKCVYWLTDRPRIHSHIWHFEIESTCIPKCIERPADLPEQATRIVLPLREERKGDPLPSFREALPLLYFTRIIDCIALRQGKNLRSVRRREESLEGTMGTLLTFEENATAQCRALRLAKESTQVLLELDINGLLPKRHDGKRPDTFHTFPLTGERHRLGVAVSAPFSLQSGRAHLAGAGSKENEAAMAKVSDLLAEAGSTLQVASERAGGDGAAWFKAFWLMWDFESAQDTALHAMKGHVARGLAKLCRSTDVIPRWDGSLRAAGEDDPISAYHGIIPEAFARALARALTDAGRVDARIPACSHYTVDKDVARQLKEILEVADGCDGNVHLLGWDDLSEFFMGANSIFGKRPDLLNTLGEALWNAKERKWRAEDQRSAAVYALRTAWLPTKDGKLRPVSEIANQKWFEEKGAPEYVLNGLAVLSPPIGDIATQLLAGAGLKTVLSWEEFRQFMDACPSFDDAGQLLAFLCEAAFWKNQNWDSERARELRETRWVAVRGVSLSLDSPDCTELLNTLPRDFRDWLLGRRDEPEPDIEIQEEHPRSDPKMVLEAICTWWRRERVKQITGYESALYPNGKPEPLVWTPGDDLEKRRAWVTLFVLSMSQTLGWTTTGKQREIAEKLIKHGFMDVFSDKDASGEDWIGVLDQHLLGRIDQITNFKHWIQLFGRIRAMAKPENLGVFVTCLSDAAKAEASGDDPRAYLNPRHTAIGQSRDEVPDGTQALGIGASFLWRELCRRDMIKRKEFDKNCYVPKASVRKLVARITRTSIEYKTGESFDASAKIASVLNKVLGRPETFERCYDIPLLLLSEDTQQSKKLRERVFGQIDPALVNFKADEPLDPLGSEERDGFWAPQQDSHTEWRTLWDGRKVPIR